MPPVDEPMFPILPGDPYFPDYASVYQPISPPKHASMQSEEFEPEEDPEEDPEEELKEEMEEEPKVGPEEDMDEDEVIMINDSKLSASIPPTPSRSFLDFHSAAPGKTDSISVLKPVTKKYNLRFPHTKKTNEPPVSESNHGNQRTAEKQTTGTFEEGQASGATPASDMGINKFSFLLEHNIQLHGEMWHVSDELSNMQGQSIKTKEEIARMNQR
ncbi:unnamed protein product [Lactuca saligna]|uniref:Uncharacterized protein n=1 Tax=Lactuca saligna TaxID=75948 RepID=A0AA36A316_LACSI|nr:unnamed protein product [Lactuca saligna]